MDCEGFSLYAMDAFGVRAMERRRNKVINLYRDYWGKKLQVLV